MGIRITGVSVPFAGLQWEMTTGDKAVARRVIRFLEDRRVLFGDRHMEDEMHCVSSVIQIRAFLTEQIVAAKKGKGLEDTLTRMRAACRKFADAAGPNAVNFSGRHGYGANPFGLALGDLRTAMGFYIAGIATTYNITIEPELARILPAQASTDDGASWVPGFASE